MASIIKPNARVYVPTFYATVAIILAIWLEMMCGFVGRKVVGVIEETNTRIDIDYIAPHSLGLWRWEMEGTCYPYTICTERFRGCVSPDFDAAFQAARTFSIFSVLLGIAGTAIMWVASFKGLNRTMFHNAAILFLVTTLCQGLTLLVFSSNACKTAKSLFPQWNATEVILDEMQRDGMNETQANKMYIDMERHVETLKVECFNETGSKMAISATVLWAVAAVTCLSVKKKRGDS